MVAFVLLDADQEGDLFVGVGVAHPLLDHVALKLLAADVGAAGHDWHDPEARDPFGKRLRPCERRWRQS